jgi:hypothetical protein
MLDEILEWLGEAVMGLIPSDWDTNTWAAFLIVWGGISIYAWFFGYYYSMSGGGIEKLNIFLRLGIVIGTAPIVMFFINQKRGG